MEFNSQICTTEKQSKRLLTLGLKKETADMKLIPYSRFAVPAHYYTNIYADDPDENNFCPAWSLHRLVEMCNKTQVGMTIGICRDEVTVDGDLFEVYDNTYDNLISIIEWLIGSDKFNENYLVSNG